MNAREIHILITDLDDCLFTTNYNVNGKPLSPQLIAHIKAQQYSESYVCTHRNAPGYAASVYLNIAGMFAFVEENRRSINAATGKLHTDPEIANIIKCKYPESVDFIQFDVHSILTSSIVQYLCEATNL